MKRVSLVSLVAAAALVALPGSAAASTYTNPSFIAIPEDTGPATPYPSSIAVADLPGAVTRVRATLNNTSHGWPENLEAMLVAPDGKYTLLMADVCGDSSTEIVNQTFTFDDGAAATLPAFGPCPGGAYHPSFPAATNGIQLPPPAPQDESPPAAMSALNGSPASGTWQLFAFDEGCCDNPPPENQIAGGWTLDLLTDAKCSGKAATLTGTAGDDELVGTPDADVILGFGGKDKIKGLAGKDTLCGGAGKDRLIGGAGKDKLLGKGGKDRLKGGGGNDTCKGGKAADTAASCEKERSI